MVNCAPPGPRSKPGDLCNLQCQAQGLRCLFLSAAKANEARQARWGKAECLAGLAPHGWSCHQGSHYDCCRRATARNTTLECHVLALDGAEKRGRGGGLLKMANKWALTCCQTGGRCSLLMTLQLEQFQLMSSSLGTRWDLFTEGVWGRQTGSSVFALHLWFGSKGLQVY